MLLSKTESPRKDLARCRAGEKYEVESARELPVGSRTGFGTERAAEIKRLVEQFIKSEWPPVEAAIRENRIRMQAQGGRPRRDEDENEDEVAAD